MVSCRTVADGLDRLLAIMERLRDPVTGCPWDREQTFASIAPFTIEEAYEVADAIHRNSDNDLREELGDLLFQVVYHAQLAREKDWFDFNDVVTGISEKLTRRHPHVFGSEPIPDADAQRRTWESHKELERTEKARGEADLLAGIPLTLPALARAVKLQKRAARVGFDWPDINGALTKIEEELAETRAALAQDPGRFAEEIGDLLFACANVARHGGVDPETALRGSNYKFEKRFRYIEQQFQDQDRRLDGASLEELDRYWEQAKNI